MTLTRLSSSESRLWPGPTSVAMNTSSSRARRCGGRRPGLGPGAGTQTQSLTVSLLLRRRVVSCSSFLPASSESRTGTGCTEFLIADQFNLIYFVKVSTSDSARWQLRLGAACSVLPAMMTRRPLRQLPPLRLDDSIPSQLSSSSLLPTGIIESQTQAQQPS
jgi:hypothetical protein